MRSVCTVPNRAMKLLEVVGATSERPHIVDEGEEPENESETASLIGHTIWPIREAVSRHLLFWSNSSCWRTVRRYASWSTAG